MAGPMERILERLRGDARRLTPQRRRILEALLSSGDHLDVEQIRSRASTGGAPVSYATVYRTMRMLVDTGLIKERHFEDGSARYEYVEEGEHHDHIICTACGQVTEFNDEVIERRQEVIVRRFGFQMTGHTHEIYGVCRDCRRVSDRKP